MSDKKERKQSREDEFDNEIADANPIAKRLHKKKGKLTVVDDSTSKTPAKLDLQFDKLADELVDAQDDDMGRVASLIYRGKQKRKVKNTEANTKNVRAVGDALTARADALRARNDLFKEMGDDYYDQLPQHKQDEIELERLRTRNDLRDEKKREEDLKKQAEAGYAGEGGSLEQKPKEDSIAEYSRKVQEKHDTLARETDKLDPNAPDYKQRVEDLAAVTYAKIEKLTEGYTSDE